MRTIKLFIFLFISVAGLVSCKGSKSASQTGSLVAADNYRLVIAFISKGSGTDAKAKDAITKFINEHAKKPAFESHNWGREGEIDYCLKLSELSTKEQKTFIEELKKLAGNSDLVQFSENAPCVHKKSGI
jgi:hypothetical protein